MARLATVAVPVLVAERSKLTTAWFRSVAGSGLKAASPRLALLGNSSKPADIDAGSVILERNDTSSSLARLASAPSMSACCTNGVTICVPPEVAILLVAKMWSADRSDGIFTIVPAATLPAVPLTTA